jgi:hypothetical protein
MSLISVMGVANKRNECANKRNGSANKRKCGTNKRTPALISVMGLAGSANKRNDKKYYRHAMKMQASLISVMTETCTHYV